MKEKISLVPEKIKKEAEESFLIPSWSISGANSHARNPFDFARSRIFGIWRPSTGISNACGKAYDEALQHYFGSEKKPSLDQLIEVGNDYLDSVKKSDWKITAKSKEQMRDLAGKKFTVAIGSFLKEVNKYEEDIQEILYIDQCFEVLCAVNGVDIPLPFVFIPDLIYINKKGELCILDHKCVGMKTKPEDAIFKYGNQAIGYVIGIETMIKSGYFDELIKKYPKIKNGVENFYFYENKNSKNRDGSDQIQKIQIPDLKKTRQLMEFLLYESVKKLYEAVSDPDHVFLINPYDNFTNGAEIIDDWLAIHTMEVDSFDIPDCKRDLMRKRQKKIRDSDLQNLPAKVIKNFKEHTNNFLTLGNMENKTNEEKIEIKFQTLGIIAKVHKKIEGLAVDTYLIQPGASQSVKSIQSRGADIALIVGADDVYIPKPLYKYEGASYVQVQVAKETKREKIMLPPSEGSNIPIGVDNFGETIYWDSSNHSACNVMIAGAVGSGKSVCLKSIMDSVEGKGEIIVLDPKYEFPNSINDQKKIEQKIESLVEEMERRIKDQERKETFIFFDELADSIMNQTKGTDLKNYGMVEVGAYKDGSPKYERKLISEKPSLSENLQILMQKGRSSGFHVIGATQRCSTKILSGDILVNFPVRICFRVPKQIDSEVILGEAGGEKLNGLGDGLILTPEMNNPTRFQGFISE